jgi:hypothetical protein
MPTVIDSLIVTLGLDNKDFQAGVKQTEKELARTRQSTDRVGKQIAASGKQAAEFFGQLQSAALKFFAVLTVGKGLINFTRDVVTTGANLSRLSKNLNISADTLHRWGKAAELNGGSMEGFLGTLQNLNGQITEIYMKGESSLSPYLRQLGVSITDATGKAKPLTTVLQDISKATEKAFPDTQQRYAYLKQMGFDEGTINLLTKGGRQLESTIKSMQGFSQADADAAYKAEQTWIKAQQRLEKLTRELVIKILPALERMAQSMVNFAEVAIPPLSKITDAFVHLDEITNGWSTTLLLALGTMRLLGGGAVISGIATLATKLSAAAAGAASLAAPLGFLLYSGGLNEGEDDELKKQQGSNYMGPTTANKPGATLAERNNNPGNLRFVGQRGASAGDKGFARFGSTVEGISALYRQLQIYSGRGLNTVSKIIGRWAPPNENNTAAYISAVSKSLGVDPNQPINVNDQSTAMKLIKGISRHESGKDYLSDKDILTGIGQAPSTRGGDTAVSVGYINVYTQATDGPGIAKSIKGDLVRQFDRGSQ